MRGASDCKADGGDAMNNSLTRRACWLGSPLPKGEGNPYHRAFLLHCAFPLPVGAGQGEGILFIMQQPQITASLQIVPNPSNNYTTISYSLSQSISNAQILIANISNGQIMELFSIGNQTSGSLIIDGSNLMSGTYRCSLVSGSAVFASENMVFIK